MKKYFHRRHAGKALAKALIQYLNQKDVIVLALPRGGVPVAFEIASKLHVPLDIFIVRKLGVPGHNELAMGAIAMGGVTVFNAEIIKNFGIPPESIQKVIDIEHRELLRREMVYRGNYSFPQITNKKVILVDDGMATGATMRAAIKALRELKPAKIIVAVPLADRRLCQKIKLLIDDLVCPLQVANFDAVATWYEDFNQVEDDEVRTLMQQAQKFHLSSDACKQ